MASMFLLSDLASGGGTTAVNEPGRKTTSPSGRYVASLEARGGQLLVPVVVDASGEVVFSDETSYSRRHGVALVWQDDDVLWIFSSGDGAFHVQATNGRWRKRASTAGRRTA